MIQNNNIYKNSIYNENIYKSELYTTENKMQILKEITFVDPGFLTTEFALLDVYPEGSNTEIFPSGFSLRNITEISGFFGGAAITSELPVSHFTKGIKNVDFRSIKTKNRYAFWMVAFQNDETKAVQVEFRITKRGLNARSIKAETIEGMALMRNFQSYDIGFFAQLATSDRGEGFNIKNLTVKFTE